MSCPVCHEELDQNEASLICNHVGHHKCITEWVNKYECCPECAVHIDKADWVLPEPESQSLLGSGLIGIGTPQTFHISTTGDALYGAYFKVEYKRYSPFSLAPIPKERPLKNSYFKSQARRR